MSSAGFQVFVALTLVDRASAQLMRFSALASKTGKQFEQMKKTMMVMGGVAATAIGGAMLSNMASFTKEAYNAGMELEKVKLRLDNLGKLSKSQRNDILGRVSKISDKYPLTRAEGLDTYLGLYSVFGNHAQTKGALDAGSKLRSHIKAYFGDQMSEKQYVDAFRTAELMTSMGAKRPGMDDLMKKIDVMVKGIDATADPQRLNFRQFYNFAKQAKIHKATLSAEGLMALTPLIQEQGGQRAGTLVQSLGRAAMLGRFGQSAQGKQYQAQWARMGLLESVELNGKLIKGVENVRRAADAIEQKGSKVRNATVRDQSTLLSNPYQWATTTLIQGMKESGVKFGNKEELAQVLRKSGIMAGNQNLASVLADMIMDRGQTAKDIKRIKAAPGLEGAWEKDMQSPVYQALRFKSNVEKLKETVGETIIPALNDLMEMINPVLEAVNKFSKAHPNVVTGVVAAGFIAGIVTLLAGVSLIIGGLIAMPAAGTAFVAVIGIIGVITALGFLYVKLKKLWQKMDSELKPKYDAAGGAEGEKKREAAQKAAVRNFFPHIAKSAQQAVNRAKLAFGQLGQIVGRSAQQAAQKARSAFNQMGVMVANAARRGVSAWRSMAGQVTSAIGRIRSAAMGVINAIIAGLRQAVGAVSGAMANMAGSMRGAIGNMQGMLRGAIGRMQTNIKNFNVNGAANPSATGRAVARALGNLGRGVVTPSTGRLFGGSHRAFMP